MKTKILLSLFLCFHIAAVFVLPNPDSILYRETEKVFATYGSLLGFNTTWRFFSPNPSLSTVEYTALKDGEELRQKKYPDSVEEVGNRDSFNRLMNYAIFMAARREFLEKYLHPYICKINPDADAIAYSIVTNRFPTIEKAQLEASAREDMTERVRNPAGEFGCANVE